MTNREYLAQLQWSEKQLMLGIFLGSGYIGTTNYTKWLEMEFNKNEKKWEPLFCQRG